ncbi:DUF6776 family protein [Pollutimonas bauzanensis]|jgi:hypothetical protein|uniref:DUF6776 family protein n=1 Tax=Pollutimonas bauzanensis TaxID=658167 RepID=UPI00333F5D65
MKKQASAVGASAPKKAPAASVPVSAHAASKSKGKWLWLVFPVFLLGLVVGGVGAKFWFNDQASQEYKAARHELETLLEQSRSSLAQANSQLDAVQGQLMVEESTRKGLEASLQASQAELGRANEQLAFFNQLLPPGPAGSVSIRALDIERKGPILQYKVLLMRTGTGADGKPFKGVMQFVATGSQQGKTVKIELPAVKLPVATSASAGDSAETSGLELSFDQFQRSGGFLSMPEDFTPQTVTLNVLDGATVRMSRTVNLPAAE